MRPTLNFDLKGDIMGTLPVLPKYSEHLGSKNPYVIDRALPSYYMADYSVLGILVGEYQEAIRILEENDFPVIQKGNSFEVVIENEARLQKVFRVLKGYGIDYEITDVVDQVYQG
jgi:hypothetical protein